MYQTFSPLIATKILTKEQKEAHYTAVIKSGLGQPLAVAVRSGTIYSPFGDRLQSVLHK